MQLRYNARYNENIKKLYGKNDFVEIKIWVEWS